MSPASSQTTLFFWKTETKSPWMCSALSELGRKKRDGEVLCGNSVCRNPLLPSSCPATALGNATAPSTRPDTDAASCQHPLHPVPLEPPRAGGCCRAPMYPREMPVWSTPWVAAGGLCTSLLPPGRVSRLVLLRSAPAEPVMPGQGGSCSVSADDSSDCAGQGEQGKLGPGLPSPRSPCTEHGGRPEVRKELTEGSEGHGTAGRARRKWSSPPMSRDLPQTSRNRGWGWLQQCGEGDATSPSTGTPSHTAPGG